MQTSANPAKPQLVRVGYISRAHNLKGELFVRLNAGRADWLDRLTDLILVKKNGENDSEIQLSVMGARPHKDGLIVSAKSIADRTAAENFIGYEVFIPENWLIAKEGDVPFLHELLGFRVIDSKLGAIGSVESFSSNGVQDLLVIRAGEREALIPFVKAFIEDLNFTDRIIRMNLPSGLLEIEP